ncbi:MAG: dihydrofolate reductase family protein [Rhodothermales bacterium]
MVTFYTATSLDGFLATLDDDVSWLDRLPPPNEDTYVPFLESIGAIAMGKSTYEFLLRHVAQGHDWPYPDRPVWVFTHGAFASRAGVTFVSGDVATVYPDMASHGNVWVVGGGELAGQFLDAGLLDELVVTVASRTLGAGKALLPRDATFELVSARPLGKGFAELRYRVA